MRITRTSAVALAFTAAAVGLAGAAFMRDDATPAARGSQNGAQASAVRNDEARPIKLSGTIWVANEAGNSLSAIDTASGRVVNTVQGIAGPHNVQVSDDGGSVWAVSGHDSSLVGIGAEDRQLTGLAATGKHPAHVVLDRAGNRAFVSNSGDDTVTAFSLKGMQPIATIPVGAYPHGMRIAPDGRMLMVANMKGGSVTLIDLQRMRPAATIAVGEAPVQVAFDRAGSAYVSLNGDDEVAKIDVATRRVIAKRPTGDGPAQTYVTADGARLLVANQGTEDRPSDTVSIYDTATMRLVGTVRTGRGAHGVAADPGSRFAFVTNMYDDDVAIVDLRSLEVVSRVKVGDMPNGISFSRSRIPVGARPDMMIDAKVPARKMADTDEHGHDGGAH